MDQEALANKMSILSSLSLDVIRNNANSSNAFRSVTTQNVYYTRATDLTLVRPILKVHDVFLTNNFVILNEGDPVDANLDTYITAKRKEQEELDKEPALRIATTTVFTDKLKDVDAWMNKTKEYIDLTKEHEGIKEIFKDTLYKGTNDNIDSDVYDFAELNLYKHKDSHELVLVTNYAVAKRMQNKYGMLSTGSRPNDANYLVLLGLIPAFVPEFKELLTDKEKEFFKLLTTPLKVYHEKASAILYEQIISEPTYNNLVKDHKVKQLKIQFKMQEERTFVEQVRQARELVYNLTDQLNAAEAALLAREKEQTYYQAGESKYEDAVSYIFEHPYLISVDLNGSTLNCLFRVPLSQWDPELVQTVYDGIKRDSERYDITRNKADVLKFLQYIMLDQTAKYWILANFSFNLQSFQWNNRKIYADNYEELQPYFFQVYKAGPNPHLEYHGCIGSYRTQIEQAAIKKNIPGLIESLLAPYKNWNIADGIVSKKMFRYIIPGIVTNNVPCIEYQGQMITLTELHEKLNPPKEKPVIKKRTRKPKPEPTDAELEEELRTQAVVEEEEDDN